MSLLGCISRANRAYTAFVIEHEYMYFLYNDQKISIFADTSNHWTTWKF